MNKQIKLIMKKITLLFLLPIVVMTSFAQETKSIRGYQGVFEVGGGVNTADSNATSYLKANFINGYKFNHSISIGYGIGVRYAINNSWTIYEKKPWILMPFIGNLRANIGYNQLGNVYPYVQVGMGFSIPWGFVANHSFGLAFKNSPITIGLSNEYLGLYREHPGDKLRPFLVALNIGFAFGKK